MVECDPKRMCRKIKKIGRKYRQICLLVTCERVVEYDHTKKNKRKIEKMKISFERVLGGDIACAP